MGLEQTFVGTTELICQKSSKMESASPPSPMSKVLGGSAPHILEQIFLDLDYDSFKDCFEVCQAWRKILKSESFQKKAKIVFPWSIDFDQWALVKASDEGNTEEIIQLLSTDLLDINGEVDDYSVPRYPPYPSKRIIKMVRPLTVAAGNGQTDVVKLLLERGADPNM